MARVPSSVGAWLLVAIPAAALFTFYAWLANGEAGAWGALKGVALSYPFVCAGLWWRDRKDPR